MPCTAGNSYTWDDPWPLGTTTPLNPASLGFSMCAGFGAILTASGWQVGKRPSSLSFALSITNALSATFTAYDSAGNAIGATTYAAPVGASSVVIPLVFVGYDIDHVSVTGLGSATSQNDATITGAALAASIFWTNFNGQYEV